VNPDGKSITEQHRPAASRVGRARTERTQGLRFATAPRAGQNAELVAISKIMCTSLHETPVPKRSRHFLG
jgi:hypothetical protein